MRVTVKYFASIREAIAVGSEVRDTQATTLAVLRDELIALGGAYSDSLARGRAVRLALNQTMVDESAALAEAPKSPFSRPSRVVKGR